MPRQQSLLITALLAATLGGCASVDERAPEPAAAIPEPVQAAGLPAPLAPVEPAPTPVTVELETLPEVVIPEEPPAPAIVWDRIRDMFAIPQDNHIRTRQELRWFSNEPTYWARVQERARRYLPFIVAEIERRGLPGELALLPIVESAYRPFAYSHGRASGLWQFTPRTGRSFDLTQNWWYDGRRDVIASTRAALDYLEALNKRFDGDWLLALASYNGGASRVKRAMAKNRAQGKPTDFWSLGLPAETRRYVPKLLAVARVVSTPESYGIELLPVTMEPYFAKVELDSQIDLALAGKLAGIPTDEVYRLNPGFNRWASDPDGPHRLLLPVDAVERFNTQLAALPANERVQWQRHRIRSGETLSHIARNHGTRVSILKSVNKLRGDNIRAGKHLLVPIASQNLSEYQLAEAQRINRIQQKSGKGTQFRHTVRGGDTLWDLSRDFGVTTRQIATWNGMAPGDTLRVGQKLVIWRNQPSTTDSARHQKITYTVRRGDSLYVIARRFKVPVNDLRRWNGLSGNLLKPGQRLTLHVDVTRQSSSL